MTLRFPASASDVEATAAPATTAPDGSFTTPAIEPTGTCAKPVEDTTRLRNIPSFTISHPLRSKFPGTLFICEPTARSAKRQGPTQSCPIPSNTSRAEATSGRARKTAAPRAKSRWMENFHLTSPEKTALSGNGASPQVCDRKPIRYRATTARPASRLLYSKPPLRSSTKVSLSPKAKPSESTPQGQVNRGFATAYFGANSVASALNLPQERDLPKNHHHSKPHLPNRTPKPDISTWQRIGHFYLALTRDTSGVARVDSGLLSLLAEMRGTSIETRHSSMRSRIRERYALYFYLPISSTWTSASSFGCYATCRRPTRFCKNSVSSRRRYHSSRAFTCTWRGRMPNPP